MKVFWRQNVKNRKHEIVVYFIDGVLLTYKTNQFTSINEMSQGITQLDIPQYFTLI